MQIKLEIKKCCLMFIASNINWWYTMPSQQWNGYTALPFVPTHKRNNWQIHENKTFYRNDCEKG